MFQKLGLQIYTVRDLLLDPDYADLTFRRLHEMGYSEVQLAGNYVEPRLLGEHPFGTLECFRPC